jgi:hypothetical protein
MYEITYWPRGIPFVGEFVSLYSETQPLYFVKCQNKQDRQCLCSLTLWRAFVTIVVMEIQRVLYVYIELHVNNSTLFAVAQQCFYGEFMASATIKLT